MSPKTISSKLTYARSCVFKGNYGEAMQILQTLATQAPRDSGVWYEYGRAAAAMMKLDIADRAWTRACELNPHDAELFGQIGHRYTDARQFDQAITHYKKAASLDPKAANPLISLAILYERGSQFNEAREVVQRCLAMDSNSEPALYLQALLDRREGNLPQAEQRFSDLIAKDPQDTFVRSACRFELGQILDKRGEVDKAMQYFREGKDLIRQRVNTQALGSSFDRFANDNRRLAKETPKNILSVWANSSKRPNGESNPRLAFLGGHPRSGTTLLEQILSLHPEIVALDEPVAFSSTVHPSFWRLDDSGVPVIEKTSVGKIGTAQKNFLRNAYVQALEREVGVKANGRVLLDKNPSLTAQLRVLLQLFPELKVIIALRDPRDVILSCYFLNVTLAASNIKFLSLEGTVEHYSFIMDAWCFVREWEGLSWLETRYEDLVANVEKEGQRVTEFLGLQWDQKQALFYEGSKGKRVNSPTYKDVSKPIYQSALGRWRAYEKYLAPVLPALEPYLKKFGYE